MGLPLKSVSAKSGATSPGPNAQAMPASSRPNAHAAIREPRMILGTFRCWESLIDPVGSKIVGNIDDLDVLEAQVLQRIVRCSDVRALAPRAATAVDHDRTVLAQLGHALSQDLHAILFARGARVLRSWDMRLQVSLAKANLQDQGFRCGGCVQSRREIRRLYEGRRGNGRRRLVIRQHTPGCTDKDRKN